MAHEVIWTDRVLENFISRANLTEDEEYLMRSRCRGFTVVQQAHHLHKSEATIHRMISKIKKKYDVVQQEYPDDFPKRKKGCIQEKFLDEN